MAKIFLFILMFLFSALDSQACTLWAYCESTIDGKEVYIGKLRDTALNHSEEVRFVQNPGELSYYGLFAVGANNEYTYNPLKAGTNERGLTVIFSSIGTIPLSIRYSLTKKELLHTILSKYNTVDEVLRDPPLLTEPKIILLADQNEIAKIEIGLEGKISIQRTDSGFLVATNHFSELTEQNLEAIPSSSRKRLRTVENILNNRLALDKNTNSKIIRAVTRSKGKVQSTSVWTSKATANEKPIIEYTPLISHGSCLKLFF